MLNINLLFLFSDLKQGTRKNTYRVSLFTFSTKVSSSSIYANCFHSKVSPDKGFTAYFKHTLQIPKFCSIFCSNF